MVNKISKKVQLDPKAAMARHMASSTAAAEDRFAKAEQITQMQPTGLSPVRPLHSVPSEAPAALLTRPLAEFSIEACVIGAIVKVPLALIDANPLSPRQIYQDEEVDKIATSLPDGQDVAAHGYVLDGRIKLIDGGTRFRAARLSGAVSLDVKIEPQPDGDLELFARARALNEQRSPTTALDFALSLKRLMERGAITSQKDVVEHIPGPDGAKLSESMVSMYMRIARMPEKIQREMSKLPQANTFRGLYAVSELFEGKEGEALDEAILLAREIIDEIERRELGVVQIAALVKSRLSGPQQRQRSQVTPLEFGANSPYKGQIKTFGKKGQVDLSLKGISEDDMPEVKAVLSKALAEFVAKKSQQG
jgi:ParB family transcriptional regulator, chromosome partitioning protein